MKVLATFELTDKKTRKFHGTKDVVLEFDTLPGYISSVEIQICKFEQEGFIANLIAEQEMQEGSDQVN
jgi:hypothetical protein